MKKKPPISIFDFIDYRQFLAAYFNYHKNSTRGFTLRSFAQKAGLSASLLKDILSKRQNLTVPALHKYAAAIDLGERETAYFEALTGFNNAAANNEKNRFVGEMLRLRGRSPVKFLDTRKYEYFSRWHHAVIRELVTHVGLGCDPDAIARRIAPTVRSAKIRKSIALLKELGLIYIDPDGVWQASDQVLSSEYEIQSVALKNYHLGMLEQAASALENCPSAEREFQGLTLSASRETFLHIKERIRSFTDELLVMAAAETGKAEEVYQINLQMFPFTRGNRDDEPRIE